MLVNGILRVGGHISEASIALEATFPMIVPPKHHLTQLLIQAFHQKLAHAGQDHMLAQLAVLHTQRKVCCALACVAGRRKGGKSK